MSPFDRILAVMTKPSVIIMYVGLVVVSFLYLDRPIAEYFYAFDIKTNLAPVGWVTKLGMSVVYLPALFILALFFRYVRRNREWEARVWFLFMCVVIPISICGFLKVLFGRARPDLWIQSDLYGFYGLQLHRPFWSFPSGHTTTIMSLVFGLSIVFPRYCYALVFTGLIVAASRILLIQHYLSDILMAAYLTLLEVGILLWFLRRKSWLAPAWVHAV